MGNCKDPTNTCGSAYCSIVTAGGNCFCGTTTNSCIELNCVNMQKEECPESVSSGTCSEDGKSGCPDGVTCTSKNGFYSMLCQSSATFATMSVLSGFFVIVAWGVMI